MGNDIFKRIKPILSKTSNWRNKGFKRFWTAALKYAADGTMPEFNEGISDASHLINTFNEFKTIIDANVKQEPKPTPVVKQPEAPKVVANTASNTIVCLGDDDFQKLIDILSYESDFFTDVERVILMDMLKRSRERDKRYHNTPFIYTTTRVSQLGFDWNDLYRLRTKLELIDIMSYEKKQTPGYEFAVTFYTIDERKLYEFVSKKYNKVG